MATTILKRSTFQKADTSDLASFKICAVVSGLNTETGYCSFYFDKIYNRFFAELEPDFVNEATDFVKNKVYFITIKIRSYINSKTSIYGLQFHLSKIEDAPEGAQPHNNIPMKCYVSRVFGEGLDKLVICKVLNDDETPNGTTIRLRAFGSLPEVEADKPIKQGKYYNVKFRLLNMKNGMRADGKCYEYPQTETKSIVDGVEVVKIKDGGKSNVQLITFEEFTPSNKIE